jgi:hypothetical protein
MKQIFLTASVLANTTLDVTPSIIRQAPFDRLFNGLMISGATINTGTLHLLKDNLEIIKVANGVTRAAGTPIDLVSDLVPVGELIDANSQLTLNVDNTTGGNLTFYIALDIDEEQ